MPTQLTNPIPLRTVTHATLDGWSVSLERKEDLTIDGPRCLLTAILNMRDQNGVVVETKVLKVAPAQAPAALRNAAIAYHEAVLAVLRAEGRLPAGTDVEDF